MTKTNNEDLHFCEFSLSLIVSFELDLLSFSTIQHEQGIEIFPLGIPRCHRCKKELILMH